MSFDRKALIGFITVSFERDWVLAAYRKLRASMEARVEQDIQKDGRL